MTTSNAINLPYKVEGTDRDERLAGELLLPFCTGTKPLKFKINMIIPLSPSLPLSSPLSVILYTLSGHNTIPAIPTQLVRGMAEGIILYNNMT